MKNSKLIYLGIVQSFGVFIYTSGVAWLLFNIEHFINGNGKADNFLMPAAMLMLLVASAAITGLIVFGKPMHLYLAGLKKEAILAVVYTLVFLFLIISTIFTGTVLW